MSSSRGKKSPRKKSHGAVSTSSVVGDDDDEIEHCAKCGELIDEGSFARAMGKKYHSQCFQCAWCQKLLSTRFYRKRGLAFCNRECGSQQKAAQDAKMAAAEGAAPVPADTASIAPPRVSSRSRVATGAADSPISPRSRSRPTAATAGTLVSPRRSSAVSAANAPVTRKKTAAAIVPVSNVSGQHHLPTSPGSAIALGGTVRRAATSAGGSRLSSHSSPGPSSAAARYSGVPAKYAPAPPDPPNLSLPPPKLPWEMAPSPSPAVPGSDPDYGFIPGAGRPRALSNPPGAGQLAVAPGQEAYGFLPGDGPARRRVASVSLAAPPAEAGPDASLARLGFHGDEDRAQKFLRIFHSLVSKDDRFLAQYSCDAFDYAGCRVLRGKLYISRMHLAFAGYMATAETNNGNNNADGDGAEQADDVAGSPPTTPWTLVRLPLPHVVAVRAFADSSFRVPVSPGNEAAQKRALAEAIGAEAPDNGLIAYTRSSSAHVFFNFEFPVEACAAVLGQLHRAAAVRYQDHLRQSAASSPSSAAQSPGTMRKSRQSIVPAVQLEDHDDDGDNDRGDGAKNFDLDTGHHRDSRDHVELPIAGEDRDGATSPDGAAHDKRKSKKFSKKVSSFFRRSKKEKSGGGSAVAVSSRESTPPSSHVAVRGKRATTWPDLSDIFPQHAYVYDDFTFAGFLVRPTARELAAEQQFDAADINAWRAFVIDRKKLEAEGDNNMASPSAVMVASDSVARGDVVPDKRALVESFLLSEQHFIIALSTILDAFVSPCIAAGHTDVLTPELFSTLVTLQSTHRSLLTRASEQLDEQLESHIGRLFCSATAFNELPQLYATLCRAHRTLSQRVREQAAQNALFARLLNDGERRCGQSLLSLLEEPPRHFFFIYTMIKLLIDGAEGEEKGKLLAVFAAYKQRYSQIEGALDPQFLAQIQNPVQLVE